MLLTRKSNRFCFPFDSPPEASFTWLELAVLKLLPDVLYTICHQIDSLTVGTKISASTASRSMKVDVSGNSNVKIGRRRAFLLMLTSVQIPFRVLRLFVRNAVTSNDLIQHFGSDLWPSSFELSKTFKMHTDFVSQSMDPGYFTIFSQKSNAEFAIDDSFKVLIENKGYGMRLGTRKLMKVVSSKSCIPPSEQWNIVYVALSTRDSDRIDLALKIYFENREVMIPSLLFHYSALYNRMSLVESFFTQNFPELIRAHDFGRREYFEIMQDSCTAMDVAVRSSNLSSARVLISLKSPVSWSHFLYASIHGNLDVAHILLDRLEINLSPSKLVELLNKTSIQLARVPANTPLIICICCRGFESPPLLSLIHRLLNLGADPNIVDDHGLSCLDYSVSLGCKSVTKAILDWKLLGNTILGSEGSTKLQKGVARLVSLVRGYLLRRHHCSETTHGFTPPPS